MYKYLYIFFLCNISNIAEGQSQLINSNYLEEITYELVNGKIIIPVEVEGKICRFIFDTGGLLVISPQLQKSLNLRSIDSGTISGVNKMKTKIDVVKINKASIGDLDFINYKAIVGDFLNIYPAECFNVDGLIGRDFIKNMAIQFDQKKLKLTLTDQPHRLALNPSKADKLSFLENKIPVIPIKINGKQMRKVIFDSGADDLFSLKTNKVLKYKKKFFKKNDLIAVYGNFSMGVSGSAPYPKKQYHVKVRDMKIGNTSISNFTSDVSKISNSRIGTELLNHGITTLDYINKKFYFDPYEEKIQTRVIEGFGFSIKIDDKNAVVNSIVINSPASNAGIRNNQKILSINDYNLTNFDTNMQCKYYLEGLPWKHESLIKVKFLSKSGVIKTVDLEKINL